MYVIKNSVFCELYYYIIENYVFYKIINFIKKNYVFDGKDYVYYNYILFILYGKIK